MNKAQPSLRFKSLNHRGQVLIEYILLLVVVVSCASILIKALVSRETGKQGMVIRAWDGIIHAIGNDLPDCKQTTYNTPNCP